jgi:hypothetical protein
MPTFSTAASLPGGGAASEQALEKLQRDTFAYFLRETNPTNGLVRDSTRPGSASSITAVGLALTAYPAGVERGFLSREEAVQRTLTTLRFFWNSPQGEEPDATGYKGFFYHFLDMESGRRAWDSELSTIDTTFLLAGGLAAAAYFDRDTPEEREIRDLATRSTGAPIGAGLRTARPRLPMGGNLRAGS